MSSMDRFRLLAISLVVVSAPLGGLTGCDNGNGGGEQAVTAMLMVDAMAQHPELVRSAMRFGLAMAIASLQIPPEQAGQLAAIGREHGPKIRDEIGAELDELVALSDKLASAADQIVVADDPEQAAGMLVMQGDLMPLTKFIGDDGPGSVFTGILDSHADLVTPVLETLDVNQGARISGVWNQVRTALWQSGERLAQAAAQGEAETDEALRDAARPVLRALGHEPDEQWAVELAIPIISEWAALEGQARQQAMDDTVTRILAEVTPAQDMLIQRTARALITLLAHPDTPDLLDKVAAK